MASPKGKAKTLEYTHRPEVKQRIRERERARRDDARRAYELAWKRANKDKCYATTSKWRSTPRGVSLTLLTSARNRAKACNVLFTLTVQFIQPIIERGVCEKTGLQFDIGPKNMRGPQLYSPSIDRIDPRKGYTPDNVQVVLWIYNRAKGCGTEAEVLQFAEAIVAQSQMRIAS